MAPEAHFRDALRAGRFELQFCSDTGRAVFFPRVLSPYSGTRLVEWREISGLGTVYSTTVTRRKPDRGGDYNIALIALDEGARMMAQVRGLAADQVSIGLRVKAQIEIPQDGAALVVFYPLEMEGTV